MQHAVVNRLTLARPFDDALLRAIDDELLPSLAGREGFEGLHIVQVADLEVILIVLFSSREALDEISSQVAAPWFASRMRPYLGGPARREVGPLLWTSRASAP